MSLLTVLRRLAGPVALVAAGPALAVVATSAPAAAAPISACDGGRGVIVVVDFNELGGGITKGCDDDGGNAADNTADAGYPLTMVTGDPGFVCRVAGKPSAAQEDCVDTPPATAYWALYWSDGKSGRWTYATLGATGLKVPAGGYVGFAWHEGTDRATPPRATPDKRVATPTPTSGSGASAGSTTAGGSTKGTSTPTKAPQAGKATKAPSAAASPAASASTSSAATATPSTTPSTAATPSSVAPTDAGSASAESSSTGVDDVRAVEPTSAEPADDGGGLPWWVGALIGVAVLAAAVSVPLLRRRAG